MTKKYDLRSIMTRAWEIRKTEGKSMSEALKEAWAEAKEPRNVTVETYPVFNQNRYGQPWVALYDAKTCRPNFDVKVGAYTGEWGKGEAGTLYVFKPIEGALYMYGQKDFRKPRFSEIKLVRYTAGQFVEIDRAAA